MTKISGHGFLLLLVLALGLLLRSPNFTSPHFVDFHSFRQAETASFAHGYLIDSFAPWRPADSRYPCRLEGQRFGWVESELPLPSWVAAVPLKVLGVHYPPAWYLRTVWLGFYLATSWFLFRLVRRLDGDPGIAVLAVFCFSVFPLSIFFTRAVMPDGPSLALGLMVLDSLARWLDERRRADEVLIVATGALLLLVKLSNAYVAFPLVYLLVRREGLVRSLLTPRYWVWLVLISVPVVAWYWHAHQAPWTFGIWSGPKATKFSDAGTLSSMRLWRRFGSRLIYDILGFAGVFLTVLGFAVGRRAESVRLAAAWMFGYLVFLCVAIRGNATHVYYQLPMVVPAGIASAAAIRWLFRRKMAGRAVLAGCLGAHVFVCNYVLSPSTKVGEYGFFHETSQFEEAIHLLEKHVAEGSFFVTTESRPEVFYNSGRRGYFIPQKVEDVAGCLRGTDHVLLVTERQWRWVRGIMKTRPEIGRRLRLLEHGRRFSVWRWRGDAPEPAAH
jgi:hypothetical protein